MPTVAKFQCQVTAVCVGSVLGAAIFLELSFVEMVSPANANKTPGGARLQGYD